MIFIKYNSQVETFAFSLDQVVKMGAKDAEAGITHISLTDGTQFELEIDIEEFFAKVFSDENLIADYVVVEIDEPSSGLEPVQFGQA